MFIIFWIIWIIFNANLTSQIAVVGAVVSLLMDMFLRKYLNYHPQTKALGVGKTFMFACLVIKYIAILAVEIVKANFTVIKFILSSRYEIEPAVITFDPGLRSNSAQVVLANSITITPGTITANLDGDKFTVHCLDKSLAEGIENSVFVKQLKAIEAIVFDDITKGGMEC